MNRTKNETFKRIISTLIKSKILCFICSIWTLVKNQHLWQRTSLTESQTRRRKKRMDPSITPEEVNRLVKFRVLHHNPFNSQDFLTVYQTFLDTRKVDHVRKLSVDRLGGHETSILGLWNKVRSTGFLSTGHRNENRPVRTLSTGPGRYTGFLSDYGLSTWPGGIMGSLNLFRTSPFPFLWR